MDLNTFKSNLSPKLRDLLSAVEIGDKGLEAQTQERFKALSRAEKDDHFFDYLLLVTALERGHRSMSRFLINSGCRVEIPEKTHIFCTPLYYAVKLKDVTLVGDLIEKGASIFDRDQNEISAVELAIQNRRPGILNELLYDLDIMPECKRRETDVPLFHIACWIGNYEVVRKCLDLGFSVNSRSVFKLRQWEGFTPVHFALQKSHYKVINLLLEHDVDFSATDHTGHSPLLAAFIKCSFPRDLYHRMVKNYVHGLYSTHFSNPSLNNGLSHFHLICYGADELDPSKHVEFVHLFVYYGVNVNSCVSGGEYDGYTALHFAVQGLRLNVVKYLLVNGADSNKMTGKGFTPLHLALGAAEPTIIEIIAGIARKNGLLSLRADPKIEDIRLSIVDLLLKYKADIDLINLRNETLIHHVFYKILRDNFQWKWTRNSLIQLLLSKSPLTINHTDDDDLSYLHIASTSNLDAVKTLVKCGASINSCVQSSRPCIIQGYSALHFAVISDKKDIARYLLKHGADPNIGIDNYKVPTPLHLCCELNPFQYRSDKADRNPVQYNIDKADHRRLWRQNQTDQLYMMELLLQHGAYANFLDSFGKTPLDRVFDCPRWLTDSFLDSDCASVDKQCNDITIRNRKMIGILMRYGADINCTNPDTYKFILPLLSNPLPGYLINWTISIIIDIFLHRGKFL